MVVQQRTRQFDQTREAQFQPQPEGPDFAHVICRNIYGRYCVPTEFLEREVPQLLAHGQVYEPETIALIASLLGPGDLVSGGAFVGDFFPALSAALAPDALYHSFEPAPVTYRAACETIMLNGLQNIRLHPVAVGETEGRLPLMVTRKDGGPAMAAAAKLIPGASGEHVIEVPVMRLDDLVPAARRVSVLHLDVEGFELPALAGATRIVTQNAPHIVLEAGGIKGQRAAKRALREMFPELRYHVVNVLENNAVFAPMP